MARNLESINKIRAEQGLPLLEKLPDEKKPVAEPNKPEEKPVQVPDKKEQTDVFDAERMELNDEQLLSVLKKKGINVGSINDLMPKADPGKLQEQQEADKLSFGLNKGFFTKKEYEKFVTDSNSPDNLVYGNYYDEAKKEDPTLSDEEIKIEFEAKYGLDAEPGTRKYKRGVGEIALMADRILKHKYAKIYQVDSAYANYEKEIADKSVRDKKITEKAPAYKADVEGLIKDLKKMKTVIGDNETYEIEIPDEALNSLKDKFFNSDYAASQIMKGWTKEELKELAAITLQNSPFYVHEVAKQYHLKRQAGTKGIPASNATQRKGTRELTPQQRQVLKEYNIEEKDLAETS